MEASQGHSWTTKGSGPRRLSSWLQGGGGSGGRAVEGGREGGEVRRQGKLLER